MDVWNDISKKISDAVDYTAKETGKLTGIAKIKYKVVNLRSKRSGLYEEIGKLRYEELRSVPTDDGVIDNTIEITALCDAITAINADINAASEELAKLRKFKHCVSCGIRIRPGMSFCPKCGTKQA
ncbi:MAG: zinc ribbon domain-containing protein [Eubacteriales bacterium]|nr:zinc ribbon domain-containing protein [Eubacteriales bacterium]